MLGTRDPEILRERVDCGSVLGMGYPAILSPLGRASDGVYNKKNPHLPEEVDDLPP